MRGRRIVALATVAWRRWAGWRRRRGRSRASGDPASDVGITAEEIRIAVVADVDNQLRPGLFSGPPARCGLREVRQPERRHRRAQARGRLHRLAPQPRRGPSAILQACEDDFALVGTAALFVSSVEDMVGCPDKAGAAVGLPDIPVVATGVPHQCAPVSYPVNPAQLDCATKDDPRRRGAPTRGRSSTTSAPGQGPPRHHRVQQRHQGRRHRRARARGRRERRGREGRRRARHLEARHPGGVRADHPAAEGRRRQLRPGRRATTRPA